jgi:hypothetical protein
MSCHADLQGLMQWGDLETLTLRRICCMSTYAHQASTSIVIVVLSVPRVNPGSMRWGLFSAAMEATALDSGAQPHVTMPVVS